MACQVLILHRKMVPGYLSNDEDEIQVLCRAVIAQNTAWYLCLRRVPSSRIGRVRVKETMLGQGNLVTLELWQFWLYLGTLGK